MAVRSLAPEGEIHKRIVVVLGMHRSGTSAIARGLMALGVDFGDKLLPAAADNEKGFFEDADANALNKEILAVLGHPWHSLVPPTAEELSASQLGGLQMRALNLIRERLGGKEAFGLKDPRISMLLPLWQSVFRHLAVDESYVLCARHPLSVASSLKKRNGFDFEKSLYLWLQHVVASFLGTEGRRRILIDFDRLMLAPAQELARIAKALEIPARAGSAEIERYASEFLSAGLRHTRYQFDDLRFTHNVPRAVLEAYALLLDLAADRKSVDDPDVHAFFGRVSQELEAMRPALEYMAGQDARVEALELRRQELEAALGDRDAQVVSLNNAAAVRDSRAHELNLLLAARDEVLQSMRRMLEERETQLHALNLQVEANTREIQELVAAAGSPANTAATASSPEAADAASQPAKPAVCDDSADIACRADVERLRLADALREVERADRRILELEQRVQEREQTLAQWPHQFIVRIDAMLEPHPGVRRVLAAPVRLLHRLLGRTTT